MSPARSQGTGTDQVVLRTRAPRFGAYYATYGAVPLKDGGAVFLYPGKQMDGSTAVTGMSVVPVDVPPVPDRAQRWKELEPDIQTAGYRWWLTKQGHDQQSVARLEAQPDWGENVQHFWTQTVPQEVAKGRPDPEMLQRFKDPNRRSAEDVNRVTAWVANAWRETLRENVLDDTREIPFLPFVPAERQGTLKPAHAMTAVTEAQLAELRKHWKNHPEVAAKLAKAKPGDFFLHLPAQATGGAGMRYFVEVRRTGQSQSERVPDVWSVYQPNDVHGPSQVRNLNYAWSPEATAFWNHPKHLGRLMLKQIHVGTFTQAGTYKAALAKLKAWKTTGDGLQVLARLLKDDVPDLQARAQAILPNLPLLKPAERDQLQAQLKKVQTGESERQSLQAAVDALSLKYGFEYTGIQFNPLSEFAGHWNWGYDGTYYFAPENAYGSPEELQELVNWCQSNGIAVVFDLVLNHLGPEGNYLGHYGGDLFNPQGFLGGSLRWDNPVARDLAKQAVRFWVENFHADGIRFDLSQEIPDYAMQEICNDIHAFKDNVALIYEDYRGQDNVTLPTNMGGVGANLQYNSWTWHGWKDFLEAVARGEQGKVGALCGSLWKGLQGGSMRPLESGFNYLINHDILGNDWRARLVTILKNVAGHHQGDAQKGFELARLAVVLHQLMPGTPLAFQGEDTAVENSLNFFTGFLQPDVSLGVFVGRGSEAKPEFNPGRAGCIGPESARESNMSRVEGRENEQYRALFHAAMRLRKAIPALWQDGRGSMSFDRFYGRNFDLFRQHRGDDVMMVHRTGRSKPSSAPDSPLNDAMFAPGSEALIVTNFGNKHQGDLEVPFPGGPAAWRLALCTDDPALGGKGILTASGQTGIRVSADGKKGYITLPPRTLAVFVKGDTISEELQGATLVARQADGRPGTAPALSTEAKRELRNHFALIS